MSIFVDFLDKLPSKNAIAVGFMLNYLSEDDTGFLEEHLKTCSPLPSNIIRNINQAFRRAGFPQFNWNNHHIDTRTKRFDGWFDEVEEATQAAIRAGYSTESANNIGPENLVKPSIKNAIAMEK